MREAPACPLDGYLLFNLIEPAKAEGELKARSNVMHLSDCTRLGSDSTRTSATQRRSPGYKNIRRGRRIQGSKRTRALHRCPHQPLMSTLVAFRFSVALRSDALEVALET